MKTFSLSQSNCRLPVAAMLACSLLGLASCGGGGESTGDATNSSASAEGEVNGRYAYITNGVDPFWTLAQAGAEKAAADLGVSVEVLMPAAGITDQKQMLEDTLTRGTDGIAVSPIDAANQSDFLNQIAERTNLITHDSDAPDSARQLFIGVDNYEAGRMCGQLVKEALPDGGSVMILVGRMEQDNARLRRQGVIDELLGRSSDSSRFDPPGSPLVGDKYTILDTLTDQFDRAKAKANAEDSISRYPDLGAMVGLFAYNPPLALQALEQAGKLGTIKLAAFDEAEGTLQGILDGHVQGTVVQDPYMYGYKSIEVLHQLKGGDQSSIPENKFMNIPARQIRQADAQAFWDDLKVKLGKE